VSLDIESLKRLNAAVLTAVEEREELRRRVRRLEAALRQIASCQPHAPGDVVHVARAALAIPAAESRETSPRTPPLDPQDAWPLYREGGRCDDLG
jgi:type II secretory pathway component PulJ